MSAAVSIRQRNKIADNVADDLRRKIEIGQFHIGARLPGRRELAASYSVAPLTVQQAMSALIAEGVIRAEAGRGTFVAATPSALQLPPAPSLGRIGILARAWGDDWNHPNEISDIVKSVERTIGELGGSSVICNIHRKDNTLRPLGEGVKVLQEKGVHGIVIVEDYGLEALIDDPCFGTVPVVFANAQNVNLPISSVYYDNIHWGGIAASHLLDRGCRKLMLFSPVNATWVLDRATGARQALRAAGLGRDALAPMIGEFVVGAQQVAVSSETYVERSIQFAENRLSYDLDFDGVIAVNDAIALTLRDVLLRRGLVAGRDYALIGFDDMPEAREAGLSSIQRPPDRLGRRAMAVLARLIAGEEGPIKVKVAAHVIARESTAGNWAGDTAQAKTLCAANLER